MASISFDRKLPHTTFYGTGPPDDLVGRNDDYYEDTKAKKRYGPKENGRWPKTFTVFEGGVGIPSTPEDDHPVTGGNTGEPIVGLLPPGGDAGEILTKLSPDDYAADWLPPGASSEEPTGATPLGIVIRGHSWAAEVSYLGVLVELNMNRDRWWTQMLRKRFSYRDNRYHYHGSARFTTGTIDDQIQAGRGDFPDVEGQITAVYMTPRSNETGTLLQYRQYRLFTNRSLAVAATPTAELLSQATTILGQVRIRVPILSWNNFERLRIAGSNSDGFLWANNHVGAGAPGDDGQVFMVVINGGQYSNHARGSSMMCQSGLQAGGWGELDVWETLRIRGAGAPITAFDGFHAPVKATGRLPIYTSPQNDFGAGADEAIIKETYRFCWSMDKALYRYLGTESVTRSNGSGAGTWTTSSATPPLGPFGNIDYFEGGIGATNPYYEIAIPATYRAGTPIALHYVSTPCRTLTGLSTDAGAPGLAGTAGDFTADDIGLPVAGTNIAASTTISAINVDGSACTMSNNATGVGFARPTTAVVGIGGGSGTLTIDGLDPAAGSYFVNGTQDDVISTDQVSGFNGNGRVGLNHPEANAGSPSGTYPAVRAFPMSRVITGNLASGAHTIRVTLNSFPSAASVSRFYQNGWGFEATNPSPPIVMHKQPTLMVTAAVYARTMDGAGGMANVALLNGWLEDLKTEFANTGRDNITLVDLDAVMAQDPVAFDGGAGGGSHPSYHGHRLIEKATFDAIASISAEVLGAA